MKTKPNTNTHNATGGQHNTPTTSNPTTAQQRPTTPRNAPATRLLCCQCRADVTADRDAETIADQVYCFRCYQLIPTLDLIALHRTYHRQHPSTLEAAPHANPSTTNAPHTATYLPLSKRLQPSDDASEITAREEAQRAEFRRYLSHRHGIRL
jgi:hypothetical protein